MRTIKYFFGIAIPIFLLISLAGCGGITTSATVDQSIGTFNLTSDIATGAADGYVYIPIGTAHSRQTINIIISSDPTPPAGYEPADGVTVSLSTIPPSTFQATSTGYYIFVRISPGTYEISVNISGTTKTITIQIKADQATHGTDPPSSDNPFSGFARKTVDLTSNSSWQSVHDRIDSIDDIELSFSATNASASPVTLDLYISQNGSLTANTIDDATPDTPPAYQVYHFTIPVGGPLLITSTPENTMNQQEFGTQILSGSFYLYGKMQPAGSTLTITDLKMHLALTLRVL